MFFQVVNVTAVGDSNKYSDVKFYVVDSGKVVNSSYSTSTMNKLNTNEMTLITSPLAVGSLSTSFYFSFPSTFPFPLFPFFPFLIPALLPHSLIVLPFLSLSFHFHIQFFHSCLSSFHPFIRFNEMICEGH